MDSEEPIKKPKIIEYVEPPKNYLQENMKRLKEKKKGKLKIGGVVVDEDTYNVMLKQFNKNAPKRNTLNIMTKEIASVGKPHKSHSVFVKREPKR